MRVDSYLISVQSVSDCQAACGVGSLCYGQFAPSPSYTCTCAPLYQLASNSSCVPIINTCATANGGCSQICTFAIDGSSKCTCNTGYYLTADNRTCAVTPSTTTTIAGQTTTTQTTTTQTTSTSTSTTPTSATTSRTSFCT